MCGKFRKGENMLQILLIKDIRLLLKDLKFQVFFLIMVALFILSAISSSVTYKAFVQEYQENFNAHQTTINDGRSLSLIRMLNRERLISVNDMPSPAVLFNIYDNYPNRLENDIMFYNPGVSKYGKGRAAAFHLNWYFILGILTGFIMLVMSFEAVSSEKRSGTLRLLSLSGFKRQNILWCKYISYMLLYIIITIPPALISMILFFALTATWDITYMMQFLLILLLSIPFASFFTFLGMFISMAKNYRTAIVIVVFIWLLFVVIIPQSATIFGKQIAPIKTSTEYRENGRAAWSDEWDTWFEKYTYKVGGNSDITDGLRAAAVYASDEKSILVQMQAQDDYKRQLKAIEQIAQLSPFTQFDRISEIIFDKGSYLFAYQQETMKNTIAQIRNLIIEQDKKDETSYNLFYSWAIGDGGNLLDGTTAFSKQMFDHPNLLFISNTPTDDPANKILKIIIRLLPIIILNLLLILGSVVKLERLDIR